MTDEFEQFKTYWNADCLEAYQEIMHVRPTPIALQRLIDEVRHDADPSTAYNRTYHRHNRS